MSTVYFTWSELKERWRLTDVGLWNLLHDEKRRIYRQVSGEMKPVGEITASEVDSLRVKQKDARLLELILHGRYVRRALTMSPLRSAGSPPIKFPSREELARSQEELRKGPSSEEIAKLRQQLGLPKEFVFRRPKTGQKSRSSLSDKPQKQPSPQTMKRPEEYRKCNPDKEKAREFAKKSWAQNPDIRTAHMVGRIQVRVDFEGGYYENDTVRNWIYKLNPKPRPGRPRKSA